MAGSHGYKFIFGSLIFYGFIAFLLTVGDGKGYEYLSADIDITMAEPVQETGNWFYDVIVGGLSWTSQQVTNLAVILINPFSGIGFIAWLSIAILITNVYIIVTSVIP